MNIGSRYKVLGKRRRAILDLPYEEVLNTFENALSDENGSRLVGSVNRETGVFKLEYKILEDRNDTYENHCMLVDLKPTNSGTKIEYAFVYDRLISWYTRILSIICFLVPLVAMLTILFKFQLTSFVHLAIYIPLFLISVFGVFSLFGYKESKFKVQPMVKEFEQLLMSAFND